MYDFLNAQIFDEALVPSQNKIRSNLQLLQKGFETAPDKNCICHNVPDYLSNYFTAIIFFAICKSKIDITEYLKLVNQCLNCFIDYISFTLMENDTLLTNDDTNIEYSENIELLKNICVLGQELHAFRIDFVNKVLNSKYFAILGQISVTDLEEQQAEFTQEYISNQEPKEKAATLKYVSG